MVFCSTDSMTGAAFQLVFATTTFTAAAVPATHLPLISAAGFTVIAWVPFLATENVLVSSPVSSSSRSLAANVPIVVVTLPSLSITV